MSILIESLAEDCGTMKGALGFTFNKLQRPRAMLSFTDDFMPDIIIVLTQEELKENSNSIVREYVSHKYPHRLCSQRCALAHPF